jgi:hypothetical protein
MRITLELSRSISGRGASWVAIVAISLVVGGIDGESDLLYSTINIRYTLAME